jgi:hypothetical protein
MVTHEPVKFAHARYSAGAELGRGAQGAVLQVQDREDPTRSGERAMLAQVETQAPYVRPSVYASTVEWVERPSGRDDRLMRAQLQERQPLVAFTMPGLQLFPTASTRTATLMATQTAMQTTPVLMAVPR